jgi:putative hydrolase of the HAD superfamily
MALYYPAPKGILFDLGDTILREVDYHAAAGIAQLFGRAGLRPEHDLESARAASIALLSEIRAMRDSEVTEFPFQSWLRLVVDRFCIDREISPADAELEFWKASARMESQPGIAAVLGWLANRNLPLGVVSNAMFSGRLLAWELARHGFGDAFEFVISSADYGLQKPHPAIFLAAVARLGLRPGEILFVGDSYHKDVQGARSAGMSAVWYNPAQAPPSDGTLTTQISTWEEFPGVIG